MKRDYELGFILNPEVSEEQIQGTLNRIEQIVANYDGQIVKINQWGRRRLAYLIERHREGYYIFMDMILTPETVAEIERTLKVSEIVMRYMTRKRDAKAVQKEREERAEREARAAEAAAAASANAALAEEEAANAEEAPAAPVAAETVTTEAVVTESVVAQDESSTAQPPVSEEPNPVPSATKDSETIEA